jgi:GntR family transcriptional regulator / MocR family aminotransferase
MRGWDFPVPLDPNATAPMFLQIARAVVQDILRGRLRPGALVPSTRELARALGVHRNTVIAAYEELTAEGWITTENGRGTFVSRRLPDPRPRRFTAIAAPPDVAEASNAFDLGAAISVEPCPSSLSAAYNLAGWPDLRLVPTKALAQAWRRAIERHRHLLSYGPPEGHRRLRAALAAMLNATRGLVVDESRLLVTRGTQGALSVIAHALVRPGDAVAVEDPGYRRTWQTLSLPGASLVPIPVDRQGLSVDHLAAVINKRPIRAVFVTPHHHFPTTVTLSPARRVRLLDLARQHRFAIVEDDYDHEFHYDGRPILPLASADATGTVIYIGTFSKTLAPGLRLGYIAAMRGVIDHLAKYRSLLDIQGDQVLEAAVAELIEDGEVQRHVRRVRRIYRARRDAMAELLVRELGDAVNITIPVGGTALWIRVAPDVDIDRWRTLSAAQGVIFETGERFSFDNQPIPNIRIGFAGYQEAELAEAVRLLAKTLAGARNAKPPSALTNNAETDRLTVAS